jgi:hypothetical protein
MGPADVPVPPEAPPPEAPPPDPPRPDAPGNKVPGTTELVAGGLVVDPVLATALLVSVLVPESVSSPVAAMLSVPPPDPHAVKLKASKMLEIQMKALERWWFFFMALACAFLCVMETVGTQSHGSPLTLRQEAKMNL